MPKAVTTLDDQEKAKRKHLSALERKIVNFLGLDHGALSKEWKRRGGRSVKLMSLTEMNQKENFLLAFLDNHQAAFLVWQMLLGIPRKLLTWPKRNAIRLKFAPGVGSRFGTFRKEIIRDYSTHRLILSVDMWGYMWG